MTKIKNFIGIITLVLMLSSCASENQARKLYSNIRKDLKENYGIEHGEVVAKFDLGGIRNDQRMFDKYYSSMINSQHGNNKFLSDFASTLRRKNEIESNATKKYLMLSAQLVSLNDKYKILSGHLASKLSSHVKQYRAGHDLGSSGSHTLNSKGHNSRGGKYFEKLAHLHHLTKNIPLFSPIFAARVTSNYGPRIHPKKGKKSFHQGLDLCGMPHCGIHSAADGVVEEISRSKGYGNSVVIRHSNSITTRYAHLSKILVYQGNKVLLGEKIGLQGCTGTSTGPHLHFEVKVRDKTANPKDFIGKDL